MAGCWTRATYGSIFVKYASMKIRRREKLGEKIEFSKVWVICKDGWRWKFWRMCVHKLMKVACDWSNAIATNVWKQCRKEEERRQN